jgi:hypothetical protein
MTNPLALTRGMMSRMAAVAILDLVHNGASTSETDGQTDRDWNLIADLEPSGSLSSEQSATILT